ncbi:restriction endonuclease subunit S [Kitasatospora sp. NPDC048194]|uniref:restriction endonuclease subunit S n=1 Tax=Kitasatospora sp. NPDC048194 TaxID=3364045 RepID=UPI003715556C
MSNTEIPPGWTFVQLEEVAEITGGIQKQQKRRPVDNVYPFLRVANVGRGSLDLEEVHEVELFEGEIERFRLKAGDLLVVEGNGSPSQIGRAAMWRGEIANAVHQNHLIRVRPSFAVDPKYLELAWNAPLVSKQLRDVAQTTSGLYTLSTAKLKRVRIPLPPLAEQARIVEALESHLSRLDLGVRDLETAQRKISAFRKAILLSLVPEKSPESWEVTTIGDAGAIDLGRQRHPDWHHGPEMRPYLRVANVFEDRIDTSDVMEMDFSGVFEKFKLKTGDVLLNEGQSPHLVGRPALYRGTPPNVAFTNSLLRFRARPDVLPEWALMVFRRHMHARRFMREIRITTNIAHLSAKRLKTVEFPIPPLEEQKRRVQRCEELLTDADALERGLSHGRVRAQRLRDALLNRAFTGALVRQDHDDEPASGLLARIEADRKLAKSAVKATRTRRTSPSATALKQPPTPPAGAAPLFRTTIQQEFEL